MSTLRVNTSEKCLHRMSTDFLSVYASVDTSVYRKSLEAQGFYAFVNSSTDFFLWVHKIEDLGSTRNA